MGKIADFFRSIGLLKASKGGDETGDLDTREDLKKEEESKPEMPEQETKPEMGEESKVETPEEPKQEM